uniref:Uncharacterized protein n=1 Tax=Arundo donax TaxID=35708 RepID=A0A0A9E7D5_ARUDO
MYIWSLVV